MPNQHHIQSIDEVYRELAAAKFRTKYIFQWKLLANSFSLIGCLVMNVLLVA